MDTLTRWTNETELTLCLTYVRRFLGGWEQGTMQHNIDMLVCLGAAFGGDDVGVLGRDIVEPCLHHADDAVRHAALFCLEGWLHEDEDGLFLEMVADHLERERSPVLRRMCEVLLEQYDQKLVDMQEMLMDDIKWDGELEHLFKETVDTSCPDCEDGALLVLLDGGVSWHCNSCGTSWDDDPREIEVEGAVEQDAWPAWALEEGASWNEPEQAEWVPEGLEEFYEVRRRTQGDVKAVVLQDQLPELLERLLDVDRALTMGFVESLAIGELCVRENNLGLHLAPLKIGVGHVLRAWSDRWTLSLEPTSFTGEDPRYLVFARF